MTMILDAATTISAPPSLMLFDDTSGRVIHYAPRVWHLDVVGGSPQISYFDDKPSDVAFLSMVLAPWYPQKEIDDLNTLAASLGITVQPARYLGKDSGGNLGSSISFPYEFPEDPRFRCKANGGQGGSFGNPIPLVISANYITGRILAKVANSPGPGGKNGPGIVMQMSSMMRGATTSFHAVVTVDYDRTYELLSTHVSWNWWYWSGDVQAAWQDLQVSGAITVEILGGTADQKTIAYKMAEWLRDMFFKPELGMVTQPTHPNSGIINTSLRYEKQHEHKKFRVEFIERDFTEAPFVCPVSTGQVDLGVHLMKQQPGIRALLDAATIDGRRPAFETVPKYYAPEFLKSQKLP